MIDILIDGSDGAEEGEIVTAEQLVAARKNKKEKKNKIIDSLNSPASNGFVDVYGKSATAGVEIKTEAAIRLVDVQNLVLWTLAEAISPRWVFLKVSTTRRYS